MIRVYLDWNVMSQMKNGKHTRLAEILADDSKFFKIFSTSHIGDIVASYDQTGANDINIRADLDYLTSITEDYCIYNTGKEIIIEQYDPHELFDQRIEEAPILAGFDFDRILEMLGDNQQAIDLIKPSISAIRNMPADPAFIEAFKNPETADQMRKFLPDLEENMTIEGVLKAFMKSFERLNEGDEYKELRQIVQSGLNINRDKLFDHEEPFKVLETAYSKIHADLPNNPSGDKYAPAWFNEITNEYLRLDMHGYQEDKVEVKKGRKQTFRNTTDDAFHAAFATSCDFYLCNDNRSYKKTEAIYEKLNLNTLVMKPDEFTEYYDNFLRFNDGSEYLKLLPIVLQKGEYELSENKLQRIYYTRVYLFNYFNKVYFWFHEGTKTNNIMLSRNKPTNNTFTYRKEINALITKLISAFGEDIELLGSFKQEEVPQLQDESWPGRKWVYNETLFTLRILSGRLQLYLG